MAGSHYSMSDLMRSGGRGLATGRMPSGVADESEAATDTSAKGFTVQLPGSESPPEQFIYEPFTDSPGAWVVYPPGIPCDTGTARISRPDPAQADDFDKMQAALDAQTGEETSPGESASSSSASSGPPSGPGMDMMTGVGSR